jgi:hypothetical protein
LRCGDAQSSGVTSEVATKAVAFWCCFEQSELALVGDNEVCKAEGVRTLTNVGFHKRALQPSQVFYISMSSKLPRPRKGLLPSIWIMDQGNMDFGFWI